MKMKSETCFGKVSGQPLTQYVDEEEALSGVEYAKSHYDNDLSPYHCDKCGFWHLSPKSRQTPSHKCHYCTSRDGVQKDSYRSKREANLRADIIYREKGILLDVYQCQFSAGWHLTKSFY